jgi:hypothetical protein
MHETCFDKETSKWIFLVGFLHYFARVNVSLF